MNQSRLFLIHKAISAPQLVLFTMLVFFLHKSLKATPYQIAAISSIRPISSFVAYWTGGYLSRNPQNTRLFLLFATVVGAVPCLFFPWVTNVWYFVFATALFWCSCKAILAPWIEQMKASLDKVKITKVLAMGNALYYSVHMVLPILLGIATDAYTYIWPYFFVCVALLQLLSLPLLKYLDVSPKKRTEPLQGWEILKTNTEFRSYLLLFYLGSAGLLAVQPILPLYFEGELNLSYTAIATAFSLCKGVSFLLTTPFWVKLSRTSSLYFINTLFLLVGSCYLGLLHYSASIPMLVYLSYICYGAFQGGSEQSWVLSGPYFSGKERSHHFTNMNLIFSGVRGAVIPYIGLTLYMLVGAKSLFLIALIPGIIGAVYGLKLHNAYEETTYANS